jgi:hypothetical protein
VESARTRPEDNQHGAQALAAAADDVFAHLPDQHPLGMKAAADDGVHGLHVVRHEATEIV